jgi:hypothetical protein
MVKIIFIFPRAETFRDYRIEAALRGLSINPLAQNGAAEIHD